MSNSKDSFIMETKLASINELLDELLVKQLDLIQDYITVTVECESHQKAGFLNLAKARYIQGSSSVSKNCLYSEDYEEEKEAILSVAREDVKYDFENEESKDADAAIATPITYQMSKLQVNPDSALETQLNKQFGFLSSGTLKSAKTEFRKCLEKTMERVSIVQQSLAIKQRYSELMKEKLQLQKVYLNRNPSLILNDKSSMGDLFEY
ncbi:hypothetical protein Ocin01_10284 [Orchesella cincta]|uniref:Vacuolar ATPase assembly protein VMA22 n=1 Tax=Orchesella cincta TaxID=48709 RepID=A0A1D2MU25_ORCCI|nr:hypothetical protein Ocin01_10284 [Orchesella cincta]